VWNGGFGPHHPFQSASSCQPGGPNFVRAHHLGADARLVLLGERVVDAGGAALPTQDRGTKARSDHPLTQPMAGMTEGRVGCPALAGRETIQRYGEVVNAGPCHLLAPSARLLSRVETSADPEFIAPARKLSARIVSREA
jgi:hypothetical protein